MFSFRRSKGCPVCGSPDNACGGHPEGSGPIVVEVPDEPTPSGDLGGADMVNVEKPSPSGGTMTVLYPRARANREGLKIVNETDPEEKQREPKTTGRTKKTASDKRRSSSSNKSKTSKAKSE